MKKFFSGVFNVIGMFFAAILILAVVFVAINCVFLPKYLTNEYTVEVDNEAREEMVIMSTNVRYFNPLDFFQKSWFYRADLLMKDVDSVKPDIIGFQEVTPIQYDYIVKNMPSYDNILAYRDNSIFKEGCAIFFRSDKYNKIDAGYFWLSTTPDVMSKDWGSEHYRVTVYAILEDKVTSERFVVFNTHLDSKSQEARINGIDVVLDKISEFGSIPAFLMGDLNAEPDSETINATKEDFDDACLIATVTDQGPTYHDWGNEEKEKRIDYVMISKGDATVSEYVIVDNNHDGVYSSDHSSIYIKTRLN